MLKILLFFFLFTFSFSLLSTPDHCPDYLSLIDSSVPSDFSEEFYQGEWYNQFDTEGTEPSICYCDRMTWLINSDNATFREYIDTYTDSIGPMKIDLKGHLATDKSKQWLRTEGAIIVGEIPNGVISMLTSKELPSSLNTYSYQAVLVYSCGENYLFQKVFQSVQVMNELNLIILVIFSWKKQIFTRDPYPDQSIVENFKERAENLGIAQADWWHQRSRPNCTFTASRLPADFIIH